MELSRQARRDQLVTDRNSKALNTANHQQRNAPSLLKRILDLLAFVVLLHAAPVLFAQSARESEGGSRLLTLVGWLFQMGLCLLLGFCRDVLIDWELVFWPNGVNWLWTILTLLIRENKICRGGGKGVVTLKRAPVPVTGNALRHIHVRCLRWSGPLASAIWMNRNRDCRYWATGSGGGRSGFGHPRRRACGGRIAGSFATAGGGPDAELVEADAASTAKLSARVVLRVLVQGNLVG